MAVSERSVGDIGKSLFSEERLLFIVISKNPVKDIIVDQIIMAGTQERANPKESR